MLVPGLAFSFSSNYQAAKSNLEVAMVRMSSGDRYSALAGAKDPAGNLSVSERMRFQIRTAGASYRNLERAKLFVQQTESVADHVVGIMQRMTEVASLATHPLLSSTELQGFEAEYQTLLSQIDELTRQTKFYDKQTIGRDGLVSFDSTSGRLKIWQLDGSDVSTVERNFGTGAVDANNTLIGFSSSEDFTLSRDGKALFFVGTNSAGNYRMKRYDFDTGRVTDGTTNLGTGDKIFVDEDGDLYVNASGTINTVNTTTMGLTATAIANIEQDSKFSVYADVATYHSTAAAEPIVTYNLSTAATATLIANATTFNTTGEHAIAASGKYIAGEEAANTITVTDTRTGSSSSIAVAGATVSTINFNEDGTRLYYLDTANKTISYVSVATTPSGAVTLTAGGSVVQAKSPETFAGLDLGGVNPNSTIEFAVAEGSPPTMQSYDALDLRTFALGIANTRVNTNANASTTLGLLETAMNRLNSGRAKLSAQGFAFTSRMDANLSFRENLSEAESAIRNVDVARESVDYANYQMRNQAAAAILSQFNTLSQNVLVLLQR